MFTVTVMFLILAFYVSVNAMHILSFVTLSFHTSHCGSVYVRILIVNAKVNKFKENAGQLILVVIFQLCFLLSWFRSKILSRIPHNFSVPHNVMFFWFVLNICSYVCPISL